jgi:hypothetical protein
LMNNPSNFGGSSLDIYGRSGMFANKIAFHTVSLNRKELEPILKIWIRVQGKARFGEKAESRLRRDELILSRSATPPWALRRIFEMGSNEGILNEVL